MVLVAVKTHKKSSVSIEKVFEEWLFMLVFCCCFVFSKGLCHYLAPKSFCVLLDKRVCLYQSSTNFHSES